MSAGRTLEVAERVMAVLSDGAFTATYKYALLLALMDTCIEGVEKNGVAPDFVTTRQLAEKFVEYYSPHLLEYREAPGAPSRVLMQNSQGGLEWGGNGVMRAIYDYRRASGSTARIIRQPAGPRPEFERLLDAVEWTLIEMPLPRLQIVGGERVTWFYRIPWGREKDTPFPPPKKRDVTLYQKGDRSSFDNRVHLTPGVAEAFVRLQPSLRPLIQTHWALKVSQLNNLGVVHLHEFLFGAARSNLRPLAEPLLEIQSGACFYCGERMTSGQVDHFIPWSRYPCNDLSNLVLAHDRCNGSKKDWLPAAPHVRSWVKRREGQHNELASVAQETDWSLSVELGDSIARAQYLAIPEQSLLWLGRNRFEKSTPGMRDEMLRLI